EAGNVALGQDLGVLNAEAMVRPRGTLERSLERVERQRVGTVADRVDADLEAARGRLERQARDLLGRHEDEPRITRIVAVRIVERRAPRAESAVGHQLEGAYHDARVADRLGALLAVVGPRRRRARGDRRVVPEGEPAALDQSAIGSEDVELDAHLVDPGQPRGEALADRLFDSLVEALGGGPWLGALKQLLGRVDEHAVGSPRASFRIRPPPDSAVARWVPAAASAAEFAHV